MRSRFSLLVIGVLCLFVASSQWYRDHGGQLIPPSQSEQLAALLSAYAGVASQLDTVSETAGCTIVGPLPDHACTPGAVFAEATPDIICVSGYSASVRSVSVGLKKKIYAAYDIAYPEARGSYELDHLIPLELGGSNEAANLFPEAAQPLPGFHEKDLVEDYLHEEVCAGRVDLAAAQKQIATNWLPVYNLLSPTQILQLKQKYKSWAN